MHVCVVGLGYIGLPTSVVIARSGIMVSGYDVNEGLVGEIARGRTLIEEEGLKEALEDALDSGKLSVSTSIDSDASVYVVAVSTSMKDDEHAIDLRALKGAVSDIGKTLKKGDLIIIESTVIPGTTENVVLPLLEEQSSMRCCEDFFLAFCPERVLPGDLMRELIENDRIIGGMDEKSALLARDFYANYVKGELHITDARTAEMAKLMENTYRAVNIALANEMALIAEKYGADIHEAIDMANNHPRVNIHRPGPGVGGYCLTKDPWFLIENYDDSVIIRDSLLINESMPDTVVSILEDELKSAGKELKGSKVAVLGIAYKGNVSDPRESPGYEILLRLREKGADAVAHDPYVVEYMGIRPEKALEDAVKGADAVVLVTGHDVYRRADWEKLAGLAKEAAVFVDTRYILPESIAGHKVRKLGVGR